MTGLITKELMKGSSTEFKNFLKTFVAVSFYVPTPLKHVRQRFQAERVFHYEDVEKMMKLFAKELARARR